MLSNDQVVPLLENGEKLSLTRERAQFYYDKCLELRLRESRQQVQALLNGIDKTFDRKFLRMVSWKYLEHRVVGSVVVEVDRLKELTAYRNCSDTHEVVQRFW